MNSGAVRSVRGGPVSRLYRRISTLRMQEALRYKAPYLLTVVYVFFYLVRPSFAFALTFDALALCTIAGIAGFGYFSNDVADRTADRITSKRNDAAALNPVQIALAFVLFALVAILPWVVCFPVDRTTAVLLALEFALLVAYVRRPLRLKERGLAGVATDALYAHALPVWIATHTVFLMAHRDTPRTFTVSLVVWQFALGVRNIIHHQMSDYEQDRASRTRTFVTAAGGARVVRFVERMVIPIEVAGFAVWMGVVSLMLPAVPVAFFIHGLARAASHGEHTTSPSARWSAMSAYCDGFCLVWMPLVAIGAVCVVDWRMVPLGVAHVVLFRRALYESIIAPWWRAASVPTAGKENP